MTSDASLTKLRFHRQQVAWPLVFILTTTYIGSILLPRQKVKIVHSGIILGRKGGRQCQDPQAI